MFGSTGDEPSVLQDVGLALLGPSGDIRDRREYSRVPGNDEEFAGDGVLGPDGHAWIVDNFLGNLVFIEVIPSLPLELDGSHCPDGAMTVDLPEDAFVYELEAYGTKLYGVGRVGNNLLLVRIDLVTCRLDFALALDLTPLGEEPDEAFDLKSADNKLAIAGRSGNKAVLIKTDLDGNLDTGFGGGDGIVDVDPDMNTGTNASFFDIGLVGGSIYGAGGSDNGEKSFLGKYAWSDGAYQAGRLLDLAPTGFDERLNDLAYIDGSGIAAGQSYDDDSYGAVLVRFSLVDLSAVNACGGDGDAFFDFGDAFNGLVRLETNSALYGVGFILNGSDLLDYLKLELGADCTIVTGFAGGANGLRFGFVGALPIAVHRAPGGGGGPADVRPAFLALRLGNFLVIGRPIVDLRRGRITGLRLFCPAFFGATDLERCSVQLAIFYSTRVQIQSSARRRTRKVTLAKASLSLPVRGSRPLTLKLTRKGRKALLRTRGRRLRARLNLSVRNRAGQRRRFNNRRLTLRVKRPARR